MRTTNWRLLAIDRAQELLRSKVLTQMDACDVHGEEVAPTDGGARLFSVAGALELAEYELDVPPQSQGAALRLVDKVLATGSVTDRKFDPPSVEWVKNLLETAKAHA